MDYKDKYIKYKNKYINLVNKMQSGGGECDFSNWIKVPNDGLHNCGIFLHKTDPTKLMKCGATLSPYVKKINSQVHLFPIEYSECTDKDNKNYVIMERFDDSITSIYYKILPNFVLKQMQLPNKIIENMQTIFSIKRYPPWVENPIIPLEEQKSKLKDISNVNIELYDKFIEELIKQWDIYNPIIIKEILKVLVKLLDLNFYYGDFKFDNFGYRLSDTIIESDFRKGDVPKIFNKYFYVYILDPESGLISCLDQSQSFEYMAKYAKKNNGFRKDELESLRIAYDSYILMKIKTDTIPIKYSTFDRLNTNFLQNYKNITDETPLQIIKDAYNWYQTNDSKTSYIKYRLLRLINDGFNMGVNREGSTLENINHPVMVSDEQVPEYSEELRKILVKPYNYLLKSYNMKNLDEILLFVRQPVFVPIQQELHEPEQQELHKPPRFKIGDKVINFYGYKGTVVNIFESYDDERLDLLKRANRIPMTTEIERYTYRVKDAECGKIFPEGPYPELSPYLGSEKF